MSSNSERTNYPDQLAQIQFNSANLPTEHQFDAWRQFLAPSFDVEPMQETTSFSYTLNSYLLDQLIVTKTTFDTVQMIRPSRKLSDSDSDFLTLQHYGKGQMQGSLDNGTPLLLKSDRIWILDSAHSYQVCGQTDHLIGLIIPRHLLVDHDKIYTDAPSLSWALNSPQGRLVLTAMHTIWQQLPCMTQTDAPIVSAGIMGLLNGLLSNQWNDIARRQLQLTTLQVLQRYIQANLHRSDLGVEHLCKAHHCSRATVYRLFQPLGGVMSYIREQRLLGCYQVLKRLQATDSQRVQDVADAWGFTNYANFSRLFKQRFGINPRALKQLSPFATDFNALQNATALSEVERWQYWLEQIV
ncbi:helix-turn-helix domain-containing protein [Spirulina major]|uniref:helix-turn-helix domain-containing protein n=1 Tax=Spirulina major TaxID=270636 RepID=UPI0009322FB6|nr:helix-turn-helix domain-containing protein [Spirulina major]